MNLGDIKFYCQLSFSDGTFDLHFFETHLQTEFTFNSNFCNFQIKLQFDIKRNIMNTSIDN